MSTGHGSVCACFLYNFLTPISHQMSVATKKLASSNCGALIFPNLRKRIPSPSIVVARNFEVHGLLSGNSWVRHHYSVHEVLAGLRLVRVVLARKCIGYLEAHESIVRFTSSALTSGGGFAKLGADVISKVNCSFGGMDPRAPFYVHLRGLSWVTEWRPNRTVLYFGPE